MSLFPAYSEPSTSNAQNVEQNNFSSFKEKDLHILKETEINENIHIEELFEPPPKKKSSKESTFTGTEDYYVDKKPIKSYLKVETLYKPACPEYKVFFSTIGKIKSQKELKPSSRYFKLKRSKNSGQVELVKQLSEDEYDSKLCEYNTNVIRFPKDIKHWLKLIEFQDQAPCKWTGLVLAEKKLDIVERALYHLPGNEDLYQLYLKMVNVCFASYEVSKKIYHLISKDPTSFFLWNAQIMTSQCSMARCLVPEILKLYEKCMKEMYKRNKKDDETMLKLFKNVALFLRQSGLYEQFIALLKLGLELNVAPDTFILPCSVESQNTLIEYEELVLKSGLPMTEIWLRIEKLRQSYYFLPCPPGFKSSSDPQRIVFNEDVCYFIYPLSKNENSFQLILYILHMLKLPLVSTSCFREKFLLDCKDSDSMEEFLMVFFNQIHDENDIFYTSFYDMLKELVVGPTFLTTILGSELYVNNLKEILLTCSETFKNKDEQKRILFLYLLLKFERLLLILEKVSKKYTEDYGKKLRSKVKKILKKEENRNVLNFYSEYILMEYEMDQMDVVENIYKIAFANEEYINEETRSSEVYYGVVSYIEILLKKGEQEKALQLILGGEKVSDATKLVILRKLIEKVGNIVSIEKNVSIMELEQYILPDHFVNLLKIRIYLQCLLGQHLEAIAALEKILQFFIEKNDRHRFLREEIFQILLKIMQWPGKNCTISNVLFFEKISNAINEFPDNLSFLCTAAVIQNQPWFKIRKLLSLNQSIISVIFQIVGIRTRFLMNKEMYLDNDQSCKSRIHNILKECTGNSLKCNALVWRLYLRSLCDRQENFERMKNILLTGLDECPWNKALYMDGCVYVPQELPHLQDLLIEKQLRIYALPEELEILRDEK
ncbi:NRDE2 family protein [Megaselia abdita]